MAERSTGWRYPQRCRNAAAMIGMFLVSFLCSATVLAHDMSSMGDMGEMDMHDSHLDRAHMKNMALHMTWSDPMPANAADQARAAEMVATLKTALDRYKDYRVAEADGYEPFHPELKNQAMVHFTKWSYALKAQFTFDPAEPTSLLYKPTDNGGYELVGAMYTAPKRWSEQDLNARVPLSVARWHKHVNICVPKKGVDRTTVDWSKFGPNGSIATEQECDAAGGRFYPTLFGWMVHVYPWETNPQEVWAH
jgi:hypothetical protein